MVIKYLSPDVSIEQIIFFRNFFGLTVLMPWLGRQGLRALHTHNVKLHLLRALTGISAMSCTFYAWGHLPLAHAALLKQTMPLFIPIIGWVWLHERLSAAVLLAIGLGFVGVLLVLNPFSEATTWDWAILAGLVGALLGGTTKISIRELRAHAEPAQKVVFYFALFATGFSLLPAILVWQPLTWANVFWLSLLGVFATLAQLLLTQAYGYASAGQLGTFTYSSVVFAALLGAWLWHEYLGMLTIFGIIIIILTGVLMVFAQTKCAD